ncbi:MAG: transcription elongation factor GreA [Chloroflexi bacterium]|nr:transcription elongation factor GreA [Chloroflexota bacterium]
MSNDNAVYLTSGGIVELRKELEYLTSVKRPALAKRLRHAIQQGDLSENADYQSAKEDQGFLEGRIQQIEAMLRRAVIIREDVSTEEVGLGSRVTIREQGSEEMERFYVVGPAEADPALGRISYQSPMGSALVGHRVGDVVAVTAPAGVTHFEIVELG